MRTEHINATFSCELTFSRRMADNSWLNSKFCGYGIPCAMIVLSSATTGLLDDNALETSGRTWRRLLVEEAGRRHDDDDDELWCWRRNAIFDDDNGNVALNIFIRFQTLDGKLDENIREAVDVIVIFGQWAVDATTIRAFDLDSNQQFMGY